MTELWAIADICAWAKLSRSAVYKIIYHHGFPAAIRITADSHRLMKISDCFNWWAVKELNLRPTD